MLINLLLIGYAFATMYVLYVLYSEYKVSVLVGVVVGLCWPVGLFSLFCSIVYSYIKTLFKPVVVSKTKRALIHNN